MYPLANANYRIYNVKECLQMKFKKIFSTILAIVLLLSTTSITAFPLGSSPTGTESKYVFIRYINSGKYIALGSESASNGQEALLMSAQSVRSQGWRFIPLDNDFYAIRCGTNSNYYLSVRSDRKVVLKYISPNASFPEDTQFWIWENSLDGTNSIMPKNNVGDDFFSVLKPSNDETADGTKIVVGDLYDGAEDSELLVFEDTARVTSVWEYNLVDNSGHCDWDAKTKYQDFVIKGASAWNSKVGTTRFRADAWNIIEDVKIVDLDSDPKGEGAFARTYNSGKIEFYTNEMDNFGNDLQRQKTVTHELGHALGLFENNDRGNIMSQGKLSYGISFGRDDIKSYNSVAEKY